MRVPAAREVLLDSRAESPTQRAAEDLLFRHLQMANGTYKTTGHGRLDDLNEWLLDRITVGVEHNLLDVGVSSGATTVDLLEAAERRGLIMPATGIDIGMDASLRRLVGGGDLLVDSQGRPLQLAIGGVRWGRPTAGATSLRSMLGRLLFGALSLPPLVSLLTTADTLPVRLLSLRARNRRSTEFVEQDLFADVASWHGRFTLVRAANILHRAYFTDDQLRGAVRLLLGYLVPPGMLLIARTADEDGVTRGTLFQRSGQGSIAIVDRFNGGSDIEELVMATSSAS